MKFTNLSLFLLLFSISLLSSCNKSEAERLAIKWCECNMQKAELFKSLDESKDPEKIGAIVNNIMIEEQNAIECMGGSEKLKALQDQLNAAEKGEFQNIYDQTRSDLCPQTIELLKKKAPKKLEPTTEDTETKDSSDSLSNEPTDSLEQTEG